MKKRIALSVTLLISVLLFALLCYCMVNINNFVDNEQENVAAAIFVWALLIFVQIVWPVAATIFLITALVLLCAKSCKRYYQTTLALVIITSILLPVAAVATVFSFAVAVFSAFFVILLALCALSYLLVFALSIVAFIDAKQSYKQQVTVSDVTAQQN